ncbi:hypothetical protein BV25DRAFT_1244600 [Artomyces pyxidatus]|uniref:Uncharacterized protein n=1 Tax=Artomyces pyxidatus TaxID=48021 RepID=A0ACB8TED7_9AGAM|nr:hypothetical protein BV25DRAFT_1244600 [Artomyces pyxidatus]
MSVAAGRDWAGDHDALGCFQCSMRFECNVVLSEYAARVGWSLERSGCVRLRACASPDDLHLRYCVSGASSVPCASYHSRGLAAVSAGGLLHGTGAAEPPCARRFRHSLHIRLQSLRPQSDGDLIFGTRTEITVFAFEASLRRAGRVPAGAAPAHVEELPRGGDVRQARAVCCVRDATELRTRPSRALARPRAPCSKLPSTTQSRAPPRL